MVYSKVSSFKLEYLHFAISESGLETDNFLVWQKGPQNADIVFLARCEEDQSRQNKKAISYETSIT